MERLFSLRRVTVLGLLVLLLLADAVPMRAQGLPPWEAAAQLRDQGTALQATLFRHQDDHSALAASAEAMAAHYRDTLQPAIAAAAPDADAAIVAALDEARRAAAAGDGPALALARGHLWTQLLRGSQAVTLAAIAEGESARAADWLRLREYRRSTAVSLVRSPADAAMQQFQRGALSPDEVALIVRDDLRDTTFFRLREALTELNSAADAGFATRAAEWAGKAQGYFATLSDDFTAKQGQTATDEVRAELEAAARAAVAGEWPAVGAATRELSEALALYQPVAFSDDELAERAQLLYLYTDLIWIEYRDAVRDGQISIEIEYQEALTFRRQAQALFEELRPTLSAASPAAAERLATLYRELGEIIGAIGPKPDVEARVAEAKGLLTESLAVDPNANRGGAALTLIDDLLTQLLVAVEAGDYATAEATRIEAYAFFETGPEVKLANRAPRLAREIEGAFWEGSQGQEGLAGLIRRQAPAATIEDRVDGLRERLADAEPFIAAASNPTITVLNSAAIIIREGLEAVLILGAIIGFLRTRAHAERYIRWVLGGVVAAIALSLLMWWASLRFLTISFSNRELLEGVTALVAAAVLFYVTNWLFQKVYVRDWMSFVKEQVGRALTTGSALGLAFLGFTVVFREGFETVLFYQTLLFDSPAPPVLAGFLIGSAIIGVVAYLILQASRRLPLKPFFNVTTILLLIMAFSFVGKGVRGLQEAGVVPATLLSWLPENLLLIELFGLYPTLQTTVAQVAFVLLIAATFAWSLQRAKPSKQQAVAAG